MKIKINEIKKQQVDTDWGKKNKIYFSTNMGWLIAYENKQCSQWIVGDEIDLASLGVTIKEVESGGKTYKNLKFPKAGGSGGNSQKVEELLTEISKKLDVICASLSTKEASARPAQTYQNQQAPVAQRASSPSSFSNNEPPPFDEDIPF